MCVCVGMGGEGMQYVFVGWVLYIIKRSIMLRMYFVCILYVCSSLIIIIVVIKKVHLQKYKSDKGLENVNVNSWTAGLERDEIFT